MYFFISLSLVISYFQLLPSVLIVEAHIHKNIKQNHNKLKLVEGLKVINFRLACRLIIVFIFSPFQPSKPHYSNI